MKLYKRKGKLSITMPEEAVFTNVEDQHRNICSWLKEDVEEILIKVKPLKKIDSTWVTLLLAIINLSKRKGIHFTFEGESEELNRIFRLYNIKVQ